MCGINAVGAQGSGCMFTLCHAPLKMGVLLHKMASVCKQPLMTVCTVVKNDFFQEGVAQNKRTATP